jgi:hypothetical protein
MALKYIIFDDAFPVIFGSYFKHADVALRTRRLAFDACGAGEITGAGFISGADDEWFVYGRSESLNKDPGPKDKEIINMVMMNR